MADQENTNEMKKNSNGNEQLKWETAKEAGKIGGNMVKKLVEKGKSELAKEIE